MEKGVVKFYNKEKGFGFIKSENHTEDIFVHATGLNQDISEKDEVTFDTQDGKKGLNAINVSLV
jgi:CspA family cold shock protein